MLLPLIETGMLPFLHDAAHGVNSTVAEVGPQNLPHQLETESSNERARSHFFLNTDFEKDEYVLTFQQASQNSFTFTVRQRVMMKMVRESEGKQL